MSGINMNVEDISPSSFFTLEPFIPSTKPTDQFSPIPTPTSGPNAHDEDLVLLLSSDDVLLKPAIPPTYQLFNCAFAPRAISTTAQNVNKFFICKSELIIPMKLQKIQL